jgi:hypothetical protein
MKIMRKLAFLFTIAAAAICITLLAHQEARATAPGSDFTIDSFFDITYWLSVSPTGDIGVRAVGVTRDGQQAEVPTDVARVIHAGEITKVYVNHPDEDLITEIEALGDQLHITGLRVVEPKKHKHKGHVTILK